MTNATQILECIADLHLGAISNREWLDRMAEIAQCHAACVISWTAGKPDTAITTCSTDPIEFDAEWIVWADNLVRRIQPGQPALLEDLERKTATDDKPNNSPLADPNLLIGYLDRDPAITLIVFQLDSKPDGWDDDDRRRLITILPGLFKGHLVHKKLTLAENRLDIANNALNGVPRAIIALAPTGEIFRSNTAGRELLENSTFTDADGRLTIADPRVMKQLENKLAEIRVLKADSLSHFIWNRSFRSSKNGRIYHLMLRAFALESWHLESSIHDRFAELIVGSPDAKILPSAAQLRDFYDLSNAQARVVVSLLAGNDVMTSAAKLHISINTVRSHMRTIYEKLGVSNQRDLLRVLSSTLVDYRSLD